MQESDHPKCVIWISRAIGHGHTAPLMLIFSLPWLLPVSCRYSRVGVASIFPLPSLSALYTCSSVLFLPLSLALLCPAFLPFPIHTTRLLPSTCLAHSAVPFESHVVPLPMCLALQFHVSLSSSSSLCLSLCLLLLYIPPFLYIPSRCQHFPAPVLHCRRQHLLRKRSHGL